MSRRNQWSPYAVAGIRDNLDRAYRKQVISADSRLDEATRLGYADSHQKVRDSTAAIAGAVSEAELFWVASDMADVALDASQDIPGLTAQDVRWPTGLMLFERPLPAQTVHAFPDRLKADGVSGPYTEPIPIDGLLWFPSESGLQIRILAKSSRLPELFHGLQTSLAIFVDAETPLPADFTDDASFLDGTAPAPHSDNLGIVAFLAAAWHLMAMPAVARTRDVQPRTGESRAAESVTVPAGQVRVVDARPMKSVQVDPHAPADGDSGRHYANRWVVRGHWRQQAHGPGRSQRRTQWIESYIKGPEDAPLAPHTLVRAWRR